MDTLPPVMIPGEITVTDTVFKPLRRVPGINILGLDTLNPGDSSRRLLVDSLSMPLAKDSLDAPITYAAEDSMIVDIPNKRVLLYDQAATNYKTMKLKSGEIVMDQSSQTLIALPAPGLDSAGLLIQRPEFTQSQDVIVSDSMRYNMKSAKGISYNADGQEGEMFVKSQRSKKMDATTFFAYNARFTTCDLDTPHFAFRAKRVKFITGKFAITGYTRPEFEGIPFPIGIPYGIFPLIDGQHSGLLPPAFTTNDQKGLGLEGLGYYKVFSQNLDFLIKGNIYSYGSWELDLDPSYYKRYHYRGSVNLAIIDTKIAFKGDPDYQQSTDFNLQWAHSSDPKANPGVTFNSSVNMMTSKYNQYQTNYVGQAYQNQVQSSIAYTKTFTGTPFYFSAAFSQNQNTQQRLWNVSLPNLNFTMNTIYPFQKKEQIGPKKWYQNLGIGYNGSYQSLISFFDTAFSFKQVLDTFQYGVHHTIPISLSLPPVGPFQIAPSVSYDETWFSRQLIRYWDNKNVKVDTTIIKGFYTQRQMSYGISASTAAYGTFNFGSGYIKAIRHVIRPQIGFSYEPDLNHGAFYSIQVDTNTNGGTQPQGDWETFNKYAGGVFSPYGQGTFGGINFSLDNNLEMKVRNSKDTTGNTPYKKVKLIDGFGFSGSYNLVADSFALSDWTIYARSNLFNKINFSGGATLDPYQVNSVGARLNKYVWSGHDFSVGRFVSGYLSASTTFESKKGKDQQSEQDSILQQKSLGNPSGTMDDDQRELNYIRSNPAEFANFNIPWHLSLSYSLTVSRTLNSNYLGYTTRTTQSVNFNGDFNLTPNWKIIGSGTFSIDTYSFQFFQASIARNLHCWQMAINVTPLGFYRSFSITLNPKSGILRDLRINRTRSYYSQQNLY
jgi:LPS-assembly protein